MQKGGVQDKFEKQIPLFKLSPLIFRLHVNWISEFYYNVWVVLCERDNPPEISFGRVQKDTDARIKGIKIQKKDNGARRGELEAVILME